ncbi:MAG: hypothetical protein H0X41_00745 [Chitinophagaceae bacterium]|nr:hypothetical protein [Chitinophagaceae bacterium]
MKKIVLSLFAAFIASSLIAQTQPAAQGRSAKQQKKLERRERINELSRQEEEGEIVYNKQHVFSIKLASDGYGLGYEIGKFKSPRKSILYNIELSEKKSPKEKREGIFDQSQLKVNYIAFGKTNTFYQLRLGAAQQQVIGGKGNKNGVMVSAIYGGGLTVGLVKPYIVDAYAFNTGETVHSKFPEVLDSNYSIIKAKGLAGGWNELKVRPGLYAKTAMRFDYGRLNETVTAIEVGLSAEYYASKISQILYSKDKQFFFNAYVAILLGRRK